MTSSNLIKVKIEKGIYFTEEQKRLLAMYSQYCSRALKLNRTYDCFLVKDREKYRIETTAVCFYDEKKIFVYCKGRLFADILRSFAHEAFHLKQHENGEEKGKTYLHFSSELEDGANEVAGKLLNAFSEVMGYNEIYDEGVETDENR